MTEEGDEESWEVLAEERLGRQGFHVKLDRGFEEGTYCVYVHFDDLAARIGVREARRQAAKYCSSIKAELDRCASHVPGETEDASRSSAKVTYLTFPVVTADGSFDDGAMKKQFRGAVVRAGQQWEQTRARAGGQRQDRRRDAFRQQLCELLASDTYGDLDGAVRERLLEEVPALAFPPRGLGL